MTRSMTGYGKGRAEGDKIAFTVELKSVNHRYCEISLKAPRSLMPLEGTIKKRVNERLRRGRVDIFVNQEFLEGGGVKPELNSSLAADYVALFRSMQSEYNLTESIDVSLLASQRDVVSLVEEDIDQTDLEETFMRALTAALTQIEAMRKVEGEELLADISMRIDSLEDMLVEVEERSTVLPGLWQKKLQDRLSRFVADGELDQQRLAQEVAVLADRSDISEEITRFRSHTGQFSSLFTVTEPVGRQMDFLLQELNREVNTVGSKSNDSEISAQVVKLKAELEKIREQVQNIE